MLGSLLIVCGIIMNRARLVHEKNEADNDRIDLELSCARYHIGSILAARTKRNTFCLQSCVTPDIIIPNVTKDSSRGNT